MIHAEETIDTRSISLVSFEKNQTEDATDIHSQATVKAGTIVKAI
jgi:hypothetical protein